MKAIKYKGVEIGRGKYYEDMVYGVASIHDLLERKLTAVFKPFNLNIAKFNILMVIKHIGKGRGISQKDISKELIVTASNTSHFIYELEKKGQITHSVQPADRRIKLIFITKKGSSLLDKVWPGYEKSLKEVSALLPEPKQRALSGLLTEWLVSLNNKIE